MTTHSPFQITTQLASKNITLKAESAEELKALTDQLLEHGDTILDNLTTLDQMILGKSPQPQAPVSSTNGSTSPSRSTPPPTGDTPSCPVHGPANDFAGKTNKAGKPYQARWYCRQYGCDAFKPQGQWVAA